jgi:hypothetical protein
MVLPRAGLDERDDPKQPSRRKLAKTLTDSQTGEIGRFFALSYQHSAIPLYPSIRWTE